MIPRHFRHPRYPRLPRPAWPALHFPIVLLVSLILCAAGVMGSRSHARPVAGHAPGVATFPTIAGTWVGTWTDTVYSVSGGLGFTITQASGTWNGTGTIDLTSLGLGTQSGSGTGSVSGDSLIFTFAAPLVGNGNGSLFGHNCAGSGSVTGPLAFGAFTFTGTENGGRILGRFRFLSVTEGAGRVVVTNTTGVDRVTWGGLKRVYR